MIKRKHNANNGKKKKVKHPIGELYAPTSTFNIEIFLYNPVVKEGDFVYLRDEEDHKVIARINELIIDQPKEKNEYIAKAEVLGYQEDGKLRLKRSPLKPESKVYSLSSDELARLLHMEKGFFVGFFADTEVPIKLNMERLLREHTAIMGRTGSGKSWFLAVLLEECAKASLPAVIFDPHGEYNSLKDAYKTEAALKMLKEQGLKPEGFDVEIIKCNPVSSEIPYDAPYIICSYNAEADDGMVRLLQSRPVSETDTLCDCSHLTIESCDLVKYSREIRKGIAMSGIMRKIRVTDLNDVHSDINYSHGKYFVKIAMDRKELREIVKPDRLVVIDLSTLDPETMKFTVSEILDNLFMERKKQLINPFIVVVEEAHIFAPSQGVEISTDTMNMLAKEARKFGMPTWFVSQRPQLMSPTIRANCGNWCVLRVTHPADQAAIIGACEGLDSQSMSTLKNLPVGTVMITGTMVDFPIIGKVRHRQSVHKYESGFQDKLKPWVGEED